MCDRVKNMWGRQRYGNASKRICDDWPADARLIHASGRGLCLWWAELQTPVLCDSRASRWATEVSPGELGLAFLMSKPCKFGHHTQSLLHLWFVFRSVSTRAWIRVEKSRGSVGDLIGVMDR